MKNVITIIKDDFRLLFVNSISILVVIGLVSVPGMYAWFNIAGSWDPYGNTNELKIAVSNEDAGFSSDYLPMDINIGGTAVSMLHENTSFDWVFVDTQTAMEGLDNGDYYAALVIPKDFSKEMMSIIAGDIQSATLVYYSNEKVNAIAPKITTKGADAIQHKINNTFSSELLNGLLKIAKDTMDYAKSDGVTSLAQEASETLGDLGNMLESVAIQLDSGKQMLESLDTLMGSLADSMPVSGNESVEEVQKNLSVIQSRCEKSSEVLNKVAKRMEELGFGDSAGEALKNMASLLSSVKNSSASVSKALVSGAIAAESVKQSFSSFSVFLQDTMSKLGQVSDDLREMSTSMRNGKAKIEALSSSATVDQIREIIGSTPTTLANIMSAPVSMNRIPVFPVENNGSSMAAFYTALSIWVGATILVAMMKTSISEQRLRKMQKANNGKKVKNWQIYFGRYAVFGALSLAQTTIIALGDLFFLQIQCVHPFLFMITAWVVALIFSLLIYTLVISFGNIGKALAVILLVLQIAASGGSFPVEMITDFYQNFYVFLPFSWAIDAFHCCIAGYIAPFLLLDILFMLLTIVPVVLLLGLVLRVPIIRLNAWVVEQLEKTGVLS